MTTLKDRILALVSASGLSLHAFEKQCGFTNGYIRSISSSMGTDKLVKILRSYPDISPDWLLLGDGPMLRSDIIPPSIPPDLSFLLSQLKVKDEQIFRLQSLLRNSLAEKDHLPSPS